MAAHRRPVAVRGRRGEGGLNELAQAAVVVAVEVEQVAAQALVERALGDPLHLEDRGAGELRRRCAQEEARGLAVEDEPADGLGAGEPARGAKPLHLLVELLPAQVRVRVVEGGEVELGDCGHRRRKPTGATAIVRAVRRSLHILLALLLLAFVLAVAAGCGDDDEPSDEPDTAQEPSTEGPRTSRRARPGWSAGSRRGRPDRARPVRRGGNRPDIRRLPGPRT